MGPRPDVRLPPAPAWENRPRHPEERFETREFGRSDLPDGRLRRCLFAMGAVWEHHLGAALPTIFPDRPAQAAAYRFLRNPHVTLEDILQPHRETLAERSRPKRTVLLA